MFVIFAVILWVFRSGSTHIIQLPRRTGLPIRKRKREGIVQDNEQPDQFQTERTA
jgi:hypothetical protein